MLVTGPTGSGKTTTLYGALAKLNRGDQNIITIDDPVEIQLPGVGQIEVNNKVGLTFANALRSVLRQDPNVVLVGEIRDLETAEIAIQASLTGHLVFSTHPHERRAERDHAPRRHGRRALPRRFVARRGARTAAGADAVRRMPRTYQARPEALAEIGIRSRGGAVKVYRARGCARCHQTGYRGRVGIFELMVMNDAAARHSSPRARRLEDHQARRRRGRHAHAARRWRAQGPRRCDLDRGGAPRTSGGRGRRGPGAL